MARIQAVLGAKYQNDEDVAFIQDEGELDRVNTMRQQLNRDVIISSKSVFHERISLESQDSSLTNIIKAMLEFNPVFRPSVKQLIENKAFDTIRVQPLEQDHEVIVKPLEENLDLTTMRKTIWDQYKLLK